MKIKIGNKWLGDGYPALIIAEIGSNHNRNLQTAGKLISVAAAGGADVVKFQTYSADSLYSVYTPILSEMKGRTKKGETPHQLIRRIEMPREWHPKLMAICRKNRVLFASTPFDLQAVSELDRLNVPFIKIASYETDDIHLLKAIGKTRRPVIMSTGNSDLATIKYAYEILRRNGAKIIILLHCVSQYPAKLNDINLKAMLTLKKHFKCLVGFSDHTTNSVSSIGAIALGASVVEKHFTLDKTLKGPDHPFSLEPVEFKKFVKDIRDMESALGDGVKRIQKSELENSRLARRSLHAACDIPKGTCISSSMLTTKRPGLGIKPRFERKIIGRTAKIFIMKDQWIMANMI